MKKNCLLLAPPSIGYVAPTGMMEIASFLESRGHSTSLALLSQYLDYDREYPITGQSVRQLDYPFMEKRQGVSKAQAKPVLKDLIETTDPIVVGVSNLFTKDYPDCLRILEICKEINETIVTVIGGPHVTFQDTVCVESPFVDIVVRGEGEWTMLDLLSVIENGGDLKKVKGITFKKNGKVIKTPDRPLGDLRELPPIDFGLLPPEFAERASFNGILNRGCVFNCAFCVEKAFWRKRRQFPVQRLIDEMKALEREYGNRFNSIEDSMVYVGSDQCFELCSEIIKQKVDIASWFSIQSRVDTITDEGIKALKNANIARVSLGIESASKKTLKAMNKNITFDQVITACRKLREYDIQVGSYWIIGHPGDTPREANRSLKALDYLFTNDLIQVADLMMFIPYPGTPFFDQPEKYGIEILTTDWSRWDRASADPVYQLKEFSADKLSEYYVNAVKIMHAHDKINRYSKWPHNYKKMVI